MGAGSGILRPKGRLTPAATTAIVSVALLPVPLVLCRLIALPGGEIRLPGLGPLRAFGVFLNQFVSFDWSPPDDRSSILFLLLLPTGALLVAIFRLTLGLRVLGLRAILLAMGFQAIGFVPSFLLMAAIVATVTAVRPWLRRIGLPLYGRLTFILCLAAALMIGAAVVGPWLGSESIWRAAFFPAIIMAMLAEGIAKTLERDDVVLASWRGAWTIVLALLLTLIDGPATSLSYRFPEIIVTQLMAIVLVSEYLDLRLLEAWPPRLSRYFDGVRRWYDGRPRVAVLRNRGPADVISALGRPGPARYRQRSVQDEVDALRAEGFDVGVFEGDRTLVGEVARFLPPDPRTSAPGGIVLNFATGVQGEGRFLHVPALLEMLGVPYTGPGPLGHARLADRVAMMSLLARAQIPVPRQLIAEDADTTPAVKLPAIVRPRCEPDAPRYVVSTRRAVRNAVRRVRRKYRQAAVIEQPVGGRRICVGLLGNDDLETLPLVEILAGGRKVCPAELDDASATRIRTLARAAFRAVGCRDYARVDLRLPDSGGPVVVDVRWVDLFAGGGAFLKAADAAGYGLGGVLRRIVTAAASRHVSEPAAASETSREAADVVSLADRRAAGGVA
jgi:D-alanine-D-alanine ligase